MCDLPAGDQAEAFCRNGGKGSFSGVRESQAVVTRKVGGILRRRRSRATPRRNGSPAERIKHGWESSFSERNHLQKKDPYCSEACG